MARQRQATAHDASLLVDEFTPIAGGMPHHCVGLEQQRGSGCHCAMAKLAVATGMGTALKSPQLLKKGLRHKQIGGHAEASTTDRSGLIKTQDLIQLLTAGGVRGT